ncbi:DExH-box ATP-dependent RNA helicase DExH15 chloroplastic [Glycine soja]
MKSVPKSNQNWFHAPLSHSLSFALDPFLFPSNSTPPSPSSPQPQPSAPSPMPRRMKKTMKKTKTKTKTTFLPTNTTMFWVRLPTRPTCSLGTMDSIGRVDKLCNEVREFGADLIDVDELTSVYDFRNNMFQQQAILAFLRGFSMVVSASTSSGKTLIAEAATVATVTRGRRIFYTTSFKALSNQKFGEFRETFGGSNVGLLTGDSAVNKDAQVLIMTTEILHKMLVVEDWLINFGNQLLTLFKEATLQRRNSHVFVAYTSAVATTLLFPINFFSRRSRVVPPLSFSIASKIILIGMIGTSCQIMYYVGVSYSSPTLASSIANLEPAFTFILAIIFRNRSVDTHIAPHSFRYCQKPLARTHRTSYRRKVEENPTLLLELCGSKKPYTALGIVEGAQSSKLSTLPVNKLDESYTPSKVSIRDDDGFHNLKEIKTVELVKATGWVYLSLSGADPRDQLEESITEKVTRQVMASFSQLQLQMQSQGLAVPPEPLVGPSGPRVSTKWSCVDPSGNDPETGDSNRCGLYIEADPARLVAMGRVYEGSTVVHNTPLLPGQVKVSVEEVTDADAPVPVPTDEVSLVGQALHTFHAWPTHLVKSLSQHVAVSPAKPPPKPDPEVDDPLYLMTLTIPELFLRPYQVRWDATVFGVFNPDFPLYIKHEDLSEIAHGGQCLSISVLQLWILHVTETCMRVGNSDIYGFLELQSIQRPDNYLKGIINSAIKGLDDAPQPKSKAFARWIVIKCNRQKGSTECGYYVMYWMSTIILGTFRNNWEATIGAREIKSIADLVGTIAAKSRSSQAKVIGSIISIVGAFVLTLYKSPSIIKAHSHDLSLPLQQPFSFLKSGDADWGIIQKVMGYTFHVGTALKGACAFSPLQIVFSVAVGVIFLGDTLHVGRDIFG